MSSVLKVQSVDRTFDILEFLATEQNGATLVQITEKLDLPKSTIHRLLGVLVQREFVRKNVDNNRYRLGPGFIALCSHYLNSLELKTESSPFMEELSVQTGNVVFLAIRQENKMVYIDNKEQINSLRKYAIIGQSKPLYCTSLGKSLLMGLDDEEIRALMKHETYEKRGPNTISNIESLLQDIRECRRRGWSLDDQEAEPAINCVAAPVYDYRGQVIAAISTSWVLAQHPTMRPEIMAVQVMKCAANISFNMGYIGGSTRL
ncbi:MAG: IclR family transcriptional regulator [Sphaerochaeta sp.]|nr:IclR family transcriptional regulator [Sphaerochaeta sp.]